MVLQDKIDLFINKAQSKISELAYTTAIDLDEAYSDPEYISLAVELSDVITCLQDELLDSVVVISTRNQAEDNCDQG